MQPKDFVEKTPENDRKLQRRLDQMAKELAQQRIGINAGKSFFGLVFEYLSYFLEALKVNEFLRICLFLSFYAFVHITVMDKVDLHFTELFANLCFVGVVFFFNKAVLNLKLL